MKGTQHKDDGIRDMFKSMDGQSPSFGMNDRIMQAIVAEAAQQATVRKYLRLALIGVGFSILILMFFVLSVSGMLGQTLARTLSIGGFSNIYPMLLSFAGLLLLFVELELIVKYWWSRELAT